MEFGAADGQFKLESKPKKSQRLTKSMFQHVYDKSNAMNTTKDRNTATRKILIN